MPFPSVEGGASPELDEIVHGPAAALTAVALVAGPQARASGWAAEAAVQLARRWRGPRRVVLVDLGLDAPSLHAVAGVPNDEGVVDVVEYGISLGVVRRRAAGGDFDVVPTGAWVTDPAAVLRAPAWSRVFVEVAQQRGTLLAYVPADAAGMEEVARRAGAVLVLAEPEESRDIVASLPHAYSVLAVLTPPGSPPVESEPAAAEPVVVAAGVEELTATSVVPEPAVEVREPSSPDVSPAPEPSRLSDEEFDRIRLPTDRESREALIADLRERQRAARMSPPADSELAARAPRSEPPPEGDVEAPAEDVRLPPSYSEHALDSRVETMGDDVALETLPPATVPAAPERSRYRTPLLFTVTVVLIVSLVAGAWRLLAGRLGFGAATTPPPAAVQEPSPPPAPAVVEPQAEELAWAVAMSAHTDLADAMRRLEALGREEGLAFHIAPLERDGRLYYHIMAGPVSDSAAAIALRDDLLARRLKTAATPTDVRHAPLAFLVGDYGTTEAAEDAMADLRRLDVPGYMLPSEAADGVLAYRVYVGGFGSEAEAEVTRQLLRSAGVRDSLVTRTGSTPR